MTFIAACGGLSVRGGHTLCRDAVVAALARANDFGVVDLRNRPTGDDVATVTALRGVHVLRGFTFGDGTVVAGVAPLCRCRVIEHCHTIAHCRVADVAICGGYDVRGGFPRCANIVMTAVATPDHLSMFDNYT